MYANDENSGPTRRGKRRSSILKVPKSPGNALDDIDPNTENNDETVQSKKVRRSSSRRVSFAETCQIKEIPNEVLEKMRPMNPDGFTIEENAPVPAPYLDCDSTCDRSVYRQPASTLAGLPSLLSSPIQETPQKARFPQFSPDDGENELDFTCYQTGGDVQDNLNKSQDAMEMTKNYKGWELEQATVVTSRYSVSPKCSPKKDDGQIELTRSYGAFIEEHQHNTTIPQDMMEMTRNYEGWEFEQSTVLTRQVKSSKVAISNQDVRTNENMERRTSYEKQEFEGSRPNSLPLLLERGSQNAESTFPTSRTMPAHSPKRDGTSFLNQLRNNATCQQSQAKNRLYNNTSIAEAHSTTGLQPIVEGDELEFTGCVGGVIQDSHLLSTSDDEVTINMMEMTRSYEGWQTANRQQSSALPTSRSKLAQSPKRNGAAFLNQLETANSTSSPQPRPRDSSFVNAPSPSSSHHKMHSPEKTAILDFTRCHHGINIETFQYQKEDDDDDRNTNPMEMTRNYEGWEKQQSNMVPSQNVNIRHKSPPEEEDNLEFTRCQSVNIETSQLQGVDMNMTANEMEMTRNYEHWEEEKSRMSSVDSKTPRNKTNLIKKMSPEKENDLEFTRCQSGNFETLQSQDVDMEMTLNHMETTRNYEEEKSKVISLGNTPRLAEDGNIETLRSQDVDMEMTSNHMETTRNYEEEKSSLENTPRLLEDNASCSRSGKMNVSASVETLENQTSLVKAVPRATSSRITMDRNFQRFEIKLPASRTAVAPLCKAEEKASTEHQAPIESVSQPSLSDQGVTISTSSAQSKAMHDLKTKLPHENESETLTKNVDDTKERVDSVNISTHSLQPEIKTETIPITITSEQTDVQVENEKDIPEEGSVEQPYTLREFMQMAGISFLRHGTRRSETPMVKCNIPKELKDKIYAKCLSDAKLQIMDDFSQQLQEEIDKNEQLFAAKEKELNENNPAIFGKLKKVVGTDNEDLVVDVIKQLNRKCQIKGKRFWYTKKKEMRTKLLVSLAEQEGKLSSDISLMKNYHKNTQDEDITMLVKAEADCDKKIQELEETLESQEKEWSEYVKDTKELKQNLETLELELESKEEQRAQISSVNEAMTCEMAELKTQKAQMEKAIEQLTGEKKLRESRAEEVRKFLLFHSSLREWVLVKYDNTELKFRFVAGTLDLDVTFGDGGEKIKDIQLASRISEISIPLALLGHRLIMEKFAMYDFLAMFPTRNELPRLLHEVSLASARVRILVETVEEISINHIVSVTDQMLAVEYSSVAKFMKFILYFDLSKLVTRGGIALTVVKKIGTASAEAISEHLSKFPSTILYFSKILEAADEILK